jgi:hypothetical protein
MGFPYGQLAVAGDASDLPCSAYLTAGGVDPACTPVVFLSACSEVWTEQPTHLPFWFKPFSIFGLSSMTMSEAVHLC